MPAPRTIRTPMTAVALAILTMLASAIPGCASTSSPNAAQPAVPASVDRQRPPPDLTIAVTVLSQPSRAGTAPTLAPARFIIEPDGQLRAAFGEGADRKHYPARTRRLSSAQVATVYERIIREGLDLRSAGIDLDQQAGPRTAFAGPDRAAPGQSLVVVRLVAHERRTLAVHDADESPRVAAFVNRLRELARARD